MKSMMIQLLFTMWEGLFSMKKQDKIQDNKLRDIIYRCTKRKCDFSELDYTQKKSILSYIRRKKIDCKVFEVRGYDLLKKCFFAYECTLKDNIQYSYNSDIIEFNTFNEYYEYLQGDIYENACYFGYEFSKNDINLIGETNYRNLNAESYSSDVIENYSYEYHKPISTKKSRDMVKHNAKMKEWLECCPPINSYKSLLYMLSTFTKEFHECNDVKIFFQYIIRKYNDSIKKEIIKYACEHPKLEVLTFADVLLSYGIESAREVVDNYNNSPATTNISRKKDFEKLLSKISNSSGANIYAMTDAGRYDSLLKLYCVKRQYFSEPYSRLFSNSWYFLTFEDMASFLNNDLSNCDLSEADITNVDFSIYIRNEWTKLPKQRTYSSYEVIKGYDEDKNEFYVKQYWLDSIGNIIQNKSHYFLYFCDFCYFLHGDLTNSDMIMCKGISNIKSIQNINYQGMKVRSEDAKKLGLSLELVPLQSNIDMFPSTVKSELETTATFLDKHTETDVESMKISYVTDIHLEFRFKANNCLTEEDIMYVIRKIVNNISSQSSEFNLIGGDVAEEPLLFKRFVDCLSKKINGYTFFTLGNHELRKFEGVEFEKTISWYKSVLQQADFYLVQNNLFVISRYGIEEITELQLKMISAQELRDMTRDANLIIFGGIGFAGKNYDYNAYNGLYGNAINRNQEIELSMDFELLYNKVVKYLSDKNVIVLTHMSIKDWSKSNTRVKGFVYVSGHDHYNYYFDNGETRIYSDNQIGYRGKEVSLKYLYTRFDYNWFSDYEDGVHEISKEDYMNFYRGIGESITFNRDYQKLYLLKKDETCMFLMTTNKGNLQILNGGAVRSARGNTINYFFEHMGNYSKSIKMFLSKYNQYLQNVSEEIKLIGGSGKIHGCIVDIDFNNHLYVNPIDGTINPYFAVSVTNKYVYKNLLTLLKENCPEIFDNYERTIDLSDELAEKGRLIISSNNSIKAKKVYVTDTEMYRVSNIFKSLQYTTKYNIVRLWNSEIADHCSEEEGYMLVNNIINPSSDNSQEKTYKPNYMRNMSSPVKKK